MKRRKYAVVGGGILGTAVAHRLIQVDPLAEIRVLEKEEDLAQHQTGRNSGVVHAGLYYTPGSLKARLCRRGVGMLREFCAEHGLPYHEIGKVLVALDEKEASRLGGIAERARANGVLDVRQLGVQELRELEPHVKGVGGLLSPSTAITDFTAVTRRLGQLVVEGGGELRTGTEVTGLREHGDGVVVTTVQAGQQRQEKYHYVVLCAGLYADRLASHVGAPPEPRIMPFRGEYYALKPPKRNLVSRLVYPVPDPRYPFLGVHLTPRVDGEVLIGPNAVLALAREGYGWRTVSPRDLVETLTWPGFAVFAPKNWRTGVAEMYGSVSRRRFVAAARKYVPSLSVDDVVTGPRGVRAQAMDRDGGLVDDFRIDHSGRVTALRNAPSPAATSSLAIAEYLVDQIVGRISA